VDVVVHNYECIQHHAGGVQVIGQLAKKSPPVVIAPEDHVATVAAAGHVIDGVGKVNSGRSSHNRPEYHYCLPPATAGELEKLNFKV